MKIAILGYGTVGSGVAAILGENKDIISRRAGENISLKYVLDIRAFPGDPVEEKLVKDIDVIVNDPEIGTVVETMGGEEPAFTFVRKALLAGKNVVTSNKVLVAARGAELLKLAKEKKANFFFEASVGGGIPVIRPLLQSLTADNILEIRGILNGTTNYMMSEMKKGAGSYGEVLKRAQDLGYAESDPSADVEGHDACRKIAILASLVLGRQVDYRDIPTRGITGLSETDFAYALALGGDIKLLGSCFIEGDKVWLRVAPEIISGDDPLCGVRDVFNAIKIKGDMLGDVLFYGKGAGSLPTASAVVSDIVQCVLNPGRNIPVVWDEEKMALGDNAEQECRFLIRVKGSPRNSPADVLPALKGARNIVLQDIDEEYGILTGPMKMGELEETKGEIPGFISSMICS